MTLRKGFTRLVAVAVLFAIVVVLVSVTSASTVDAATYDVTVLREQQVLITTEVVDPAHIPRTVEITVITVTNEEIQGTSDGQVLFRAGFNQEQRQATYTAPDTAESMTGIAVTNEAQGTNNDVFAMSLELFSASVLLIAAIAFAGLFAAATVFRRDAPRFFVRLAITTLGRVLGIMMTMIMEVYGIRRLVPGPRAVAFAALIVVTMFVAQRDSALAGNAG